MPGIVQLAQSDNERAAVIDDAAQVSADDIGADVLNALVDVDRIASSAQVSTVVSTVVTLRSTGIAACHLPHRRMRPVRGRRR